MPPEGRGGPTLLDSPARHAVTTRRTGARAEPWPAPSSAIRPILKWAGGKRQLLPYFRRFFPSSFRRYYEPFVGSGAVFFDLYSSGLLRSKAATLTDSNPDLIGCYAAVRDDPAEVARVLERLAAGHQRAGAAHFYLVRDEFNEARAALVPSGRYTPRLAAMLIYLNRTGFNGLFRLNADGRFNVPVGRYVRPRFVRAEHLHAVAAVLRRPGIRLALAPFEAVLRTAREGDFLYFDPPYAPVSPTSSFTAYTSARFTLEDHARLRDVAVRLAERGCYVMVSNSSAPAVTALYRTPAVAAAGLRVWELPARRAISSRGSGRGPVTELLLTNLAPDGQARDG